MKDYAVLLIVLFFLVLTTLLVHLLYIRWWACSYFYNYKNFPRHGWKLVTHLWSLPWKHTSIKWNTIRYRSKQKTENRSKNLHKERKENGREMKQGHGNKWQLHATWGHWGICARSINFSKETTKAKNDLWSVRILLVALRTNQKSYNLKI